MIGDATRNKTRDETHEESNRAAAGAPAGVAEGGGEELKKSHHPSPPKKPADEDPFGAGIPSTELQAGEKTAPEGREALPEPRPEKGSGEAQRAAGRGRRAKARRRRTRRGGDDETTPEPAVSDAGEEAGPPAAVVTAPSGTATGRKPRKRRSSRKSSAAGTAPAGPGPQDAGDPQHDLTTGATAAVEVEPAAPAAGKDSQTPRRSRATKRRRASKKSEDAGRKAASPEPPGPQKARPVNRRRPARANTRLLVDTTDNQEVRIAVLEKDRLEQLFYERAKEQKYLGNIYRGRVVNLEPAIQAAFVDLGIGRNGFLHVSDVLPAYRNATRIPFDHMSEHLGDRRGLKIQDILRRGQELLVQITKDSIGNKGPSLTTYVSLPGKYIVLMPGVSRCGVSKRIEDGVQRASLREKLSSLSPPPGMGYIVRTAGQDKPVELLEKDLKAVLTIWNEIRDRVAQATGPGMIYAEADLVIRAMRDLFGAEVDEILIDDEEVYRRARAFLADVMPQAEARVKRYTGSTPIFARFGVEEEIEKIYNRRVPLPSGGYLVIEQTEALVAIDVNSGKYRAEEDLEATALKTNLEAAEEIARQLRLRDLGGVIINDFIDMENLNNRREVERAFRAALKKDRAKCWMTRISRFGIIEMTRQRARSSFERANQHPCPTCQGTGTIKSPKSVGMAILRELRGALASKRRPVCEVTAHPVVAEYLTNERRLSLLELEDEFQKTILVRTGQGVPRDQYVVRFSS